MGAPNKNQNARKPREKRKSVNLTIPIEIAESERINEARAKQGHCSRAAWGRCAILNELNRKPFDPNVSGEIQGIMRDTESLLDAILATRISSNTATRAKQINRRIRRIITNEKMDS